MRSTKRNVVLCLLVLALLASMLIFASCSKKPEEHQHSYSETVVAPTCTTNGYTKHTCSCGDSYTDNETPAAHTMTQVVQKEPTCTAEGYASHSVCSVCGYTDNSATVIPMIPHVFEVSYTYPTVTTAGSRTSVCKVCKTSKTVTINALSASLPNASEVIAKMIGTVAATVEITEGSEFVYVTEPAEGSEATATKCAVFFEIAEAAIDGKGEMLKGHLKLKVGMAETALTGLVPAEDVVVDKTNAEYLELYIYVNGEDLSIEFNDEQVRTENVSEMLYGAVAQLLGLNDYEQLMEAAYLMQSVSNLMPLVEKAMDAAVEGLPTLSPEYTQHLSEVFALLGEEIVTETTDASGNTVYSLNPAALKKLMNGFEGKTVAEYLKGVYGEDVVGALASFLKTMPDKTVKEIANAAVDFTEGTGVDIGEVYMLIDLYVYFATETEFNMENEIVNRYDKTVAEILAELSDVPAAEKADFIASMKESLTGAAETLETVTVDQLLSMMFVGAEEGFIEDLLATIDMLDEAVTVDVTVDANGNLVSILAQTPDASFHYVANADDMTLTIVSGDVEYVLTINENGMTAVAKKDGVQIATGSMTITETVEGDQTTVVIDADVRDDRNDLLDYHFVLVNGEIISGNVAFRGYTYETVSIPNTNQTQTVESFETFFTVEYAKADDGNSELAFTVGETEIHVLTTNDTVTLIAKENGAIVATINLTSTQTGMSLEICDDKSTMLFFELQLNEAMDTLVKAELEVNDYVSVETEAEGTIRELQQIFQASYELTDNETGMDVIRLEVQGMAFLFGYEITENGANFHLLDENMEMLNAAVSILESENSVAIDVLAELFDETFLDLLVTVTSNEGEFAITIDLDKLVLASNPDLSAYATFDGGLKLKVA